MGFGDRQPSILAAGKARCGGCKVDRSSEQREILKEVVRLLASARATPDHTHKPDFDDGRVDGYVVTALTAARAALSIAAQRENPAEAREPNL
jgi:hypothetical protein